MILYSIIPVDIVFDTNWGKDEKTNNYIEMDYLGEKIQAMVNGNNEYVITRLLSTSPKSFLNPRLQPGTIIKSK